MNTSDVMMAVVDRLFYGQRKEFASERAMLSAVSHRCECLHLSPHATDVALTKAKDEVADGGSYSAGYSAGVNSAERSAAQMRAIRTRHGTRPDDGPKDAA